MKTVLPKTSKEIVEMGNQYSFYTWHAQKDPSLRTMAIDYGEGCYIYDVDGNEYFDMASELVNVNVGHGRQRIVDAIAAQASKIPYCRPSDMTAVRAALSKKIVEEFAPANMAKVMYSGGGAEANEFAIRLAKAATGRTKILSQYMSYHGSSYGTAVLSGDTVHEAPDPTIPGFVRFYGPNWSTCKAKFKTEEERCEFLVGILKDTIELEGAETIAAIFFESITGGNGAIVPPKGYYEAARKICDEHGILMVADEVMVGFCRTGKNFACQHFDYLPDMITFAKGSTCGYLPLGGVIISKKLSDIFDEVGVPCGCTYSGHAACCAAALETLEIYQEENLADNAAKMGDYLSEKLEELKEKHSSVEEITGKGLMKAVHFNTKIYQVENYVDKITEAFLERKVIVSSRTGAFLVVPPLIVTKEQIDYIIGIIDDVLSLTDEWVAAV